MMSFTRDKLFIPQPIWKGQEAFIIGGGNSLRGFNFKSLEGLNTIGVNFAFKWGPSLVKWVCFSDIDWFNKTIHELKSYTKAGGQLVSATTSMEDLNLPWVHKMQRVREGLGSQHGLIGWNYNTGAMAINLALYFGVTTIYLLGFDMCRSQRGASHWHSHYSRVTQEKSFLRHLGGFDILKKGLSQNFPEVKVLNVTNGESKLTAFPTISFESFYGHLAQKGAQ